MVARINIEFNNSSKYIGYILNNKMNVNSCDTLLLPNDSNKPRYVGRRSTCMSPMRFNSTGSSGSDEEVSSLTSPPELDSGRNYLIVR